ncbi:spore coat protein, CotS family [Fontibacillus panacisegetis]|uniref:Spore coat protein, CotS family n=1 Tax=Fontibacillus panacisegetis TaxID=670482 RepID=A0A1G7JUZ7_9BACL|nr:CotS family spore coat protein [Fontibacillus panacisegetis]SDF28780.1 spore coat protein, CotS family [Fontibacillus panacisegetis]
MLDPLLLAASSHYGFSIENYDLLHETSRTLVVSLETTKGSYVLKSIYVTEKRLQFILEVEHFLREKGISIPMVYPTLSGESYLNWEGDLFVLQEKIQGTSNSPSSLDAITSKAALLGTMHNVSLGFHSHFGPDYAEEHDWEKHYIRKIRDMLEWKDRFSKSKSAKKKMILEGINDYLKAGIRALKLIQLHAQFQQWKDLPPHEHFIAHGDFHSENILYTEEQLYIIDWEFVRYNYPSKDIGRLLNSILKHSESWDNASFQNLIQHYTRYNPLNDWQLQMLYLDLSFPHNFYRFLQNRMYKEMSIEEIEVFLRREHDKTSYLIKEYPN